MAKFPIIISVLAASTITFASSVLSTPVFAGPLDRDTTACAIAREAPTDANIEACTGESVDLSGSIVSGEKDRG